jgi:hypothetical protein
VALGGQYDYKSSVLEALPGFRFNVREVEMGTRRPLILQMVHDPSALEPRCNFQVFFSLCPYFKWLLDIFGKMEREWKLDLRMRFMLKQLASSFQQVK